MDVQKMQKELEHLLAEVHWIQQKLKNLPEENISCERDKQYIRWYLISEGKRNYLPRSQEKLANKLMHHHTHEELTNFYLQILPITIFYFQQFSMMKFHGQQPTIKDPITIQKN